jgi:hypothetical protein
LANDGYTTIFHRDQWKTEYGVHIKEELVWPETSSKTVVEEV